MVVFSMMAITREAAVTCNSAPSTVLHRIKAQASTTANTPKSRTVSSRKAIKRSPSLAKRYRPAPRTGAGVERAVAAGLDSMTPHSSRRCWPAGIAPPQRLQCLECELTWLWQCGHSIFCEGPYVSWSSIRLQRMDLVTPKDSGRTAIVQLVTTETEAIQGCEGNRPACYRPARTDRSKGGNQGTL